MKMKNVLSRVALTTFVCTILVSSAFARPIIIAEWDEWGRKSKDCAGWGLCDVVWFPEENQLQYSAPVEYDETTNTYYMIVLSPQPVPAGDQEHQILPVDEDITLYTQSVIGQNLIIPAGEYPLDLNYGEYGGYRIDML